MRGLMITITIACIVLFLWVTFGGFVSFVAAILLCVVPTPLVIIAIYARGDLQAFAIGALVPWVVLILLRAPVFESNFTIWIWLLPTCAFCGALASATRRWLERNRWG
jgi:hypothetical protein